MPPRIPGFLAKTAGIVAFIALLPSPAWAQGAERVTLPSWGITIWGTSYHVDDGIDYTHGNWGLGVRRYMRPDWRWLGKNEENRIVLEADALRNSNGGLMVPVSAGAEFRLGTLVGPCGLFGVGSIAMAYYQNPRRDTTEIKIGPVPGLTLGCGSIKLNAIAIFRPDSQPLAAIVGSLTIVF